MAGLMERTAYTRPRVRDYGSLVDLTADFDLTFAGSVAKVVTMAAVSSPLSTADALGRGTSPGAGDGQLGEAGSGGSGGGDPGGGGGDPGGGGGVSLPGMGGKLPFTGYPALLIATLGAGLAAAGTALRLRFRRSR